MHEGRQRDPGYFSNRCGPVNPVYLGKRVSAKILHLVFERAHENRFVKSNGYGCTLETGMQVTSAIELVFLLACRGQ